MVDLLVACESPFLQWLDRTSIEKGGREAPLRMPSSRKGARCKIKAPVRL